MADASPSIGRFLVPMVLVGLVAALGIVVFTKKPQPATPPPAADAAVKVQDPQPVPGGAFSGALHATVQPPQELATIGGIDADAKSGPLMQVAFRQEGAGIDWLRMARFHAEIAPASPHEVLQQTQAHKSGAGEQALVPMAMLQVEIDGQVVKLAGIYRNAAGAPAGFDWKQTTPGVFVAEIVDEAGRPVARVTRTYRVIENLYEVTLDQRVENLTDKPLSVRFTQLGPVELPIGVIRYGGDPRRVRLGIMEGDATGSHIEGRSPILQRADVLAHPAQLNGQVVWPDTPIWPSAKSKEAGQSLSWIGLTNRFFAVTVHALPSHQPERKDLPKPQPDRRLSSWESIDRVVLTRDADSGGKLETNAAFALRAHSPVMTVPAGGSVSADLGIYAGPIDRETLAAANKVDGGISLTDLEIYFWPGPCSFCTFQFIAYGLRWVLSFFAEHVTFDWALAIILLVVCVRSALHPVTKWSQISLQRFGKAMQRVAPKQKALQEKFKDDPARLRQEMATLMREENVNYAQALGCLPMLLQTPIWIALSSLMFFLFDLRHTPAFFGLFQTASGGKWQFLADLAEPDHFIALPWHFSLPMMGHIDSINALPIILGLVFFVQQKYLTPPPTAQLSPEMEMQQRIMKIVIVFLFPVMMYNAPSGLALYFITNSSLGILESRHIRKVFEKSEKDREELLKRNPHAFSGKDAKPGFFGRIQQRMAAARQQAEAVQQHRQQQAKRDGKSGR